MEPKTLLKILYLAIEVSTQKNTKTCNTLLIINCNNILFVVEVHVQVEAKKKPKKTKISYANTSYAKGGKCLLEKLVENRHFNKFPSCLSQYNTAIVLTSLVWSKRLFFSCYKILCSPNNKSLFFQSNNIIPIPAY